MRQVCVDVNRAADVRISEGLKTEHALLNGTMLGEYMRLTGYLKL